ncbi:amino acid permease [Klebsiella pneumoniae]|uniref:amino acid permease n=1 Tax=Klebsiella pneumoniae TaxID=573 RepID=UPI00114414AB|nr:amino acid permease [Klebsiella pneumoniae]TYW65000.1 amino acid permease [Klebsiella pneumoniae]
MTTQQEHQLKRGLKNRHIQLIALGGAVGTGLFLGIAQTIRMAGPSVLLGYAIAGVIAFFIMRQLGEMVVEEPVAGSFSHFANRYWGPFAGFMSGWNYWVLYVLVSMAELTAVGIYIQYWWPEVPTWLSAAIFFVAINAINLTHVKVYGELEFWFSIVKVAAIISMIAFGCYLLFSGHGGPAATVANLWQDGGFFPNGITGLVMAMAVIMFSFGGLELVGITAALSVYNSCVYCNSRMLFGLAQQGNAPRALLRVNHRGIPLTALAVSAVATALCVVINYVMPGKAFALLMALVVAALVINWAMICITHLKFRRAMQRAGKVTAFQSFAYPLTNWLCLLFLAAIFGVMYLTPDIRISVCLIPVWLLILAAGYLLRRKSAPAPVAALEER